MSSSTLIVGKEAQQKKCETEEVSRRVEAGKRGEMAVHLEMCTRCITQGWLNLRGDVEGRGNGGGGRVGGDVEGCEEGGRDV